MTRILLALLVALPCFGQLTMYVVDGTTETVLAPNALLQMKPIESGDTQSVRLRVRNLGAQDAQITQFSADGAGFSLQRPFPPIALAAGGAVNATLVFTAGAPASYSANLRMNGTTVLVLVNVNAGPTLTIVPQCAGTSANTVNFGEVVRGQPKTCTATLTNGGTQTSTISTLSVSGSGFSVAPNAVPFSLAAGQSITLTLQLSAVSTGVIAGALQVQGRAYALAAVSIEAPLPQPILEFDSTVFGSAQQRRVTVKLAAPAAVAASGTLTLAFQPDSALAGDDPAVMFVESATRQLKFAVEAGKSMVTLNGRDFATLQTGTSAGRLRFTFGDYAPGFQVDPTITMTVPAAQVTLEKAIATKAPNRLDVTLTGFDNTYSVGAMVFRFYDASGQLIGSAIPADFSAAFRAFFTNTPGGSVFRMTVTFPVNNNSSVAGVEAELSNAAGTMRTARLAF